MGILDKAKQFIAQHDEQIDSAAAKAGDFVDRKTKGKYSDKIGSAVGTVQKATGDAKPAAGSAQPADSAQAVQPDQTDQTGQTGPAGKPGEAPQPGA